MGVNQAPTRNSESEGDGVPMNLKQAASRQTVNDGIDRHRRARDRYELEKREIGGKERGEDRGKMEQRGGYK